jgi:excisionase family DNA binding protein
VDSTRALLTAEETAEELRESVKTVRRWAREKLIPSIKIGRRLLFRRTALEALLKKLETR